LRCLYLIFKYKLPDNASDYLFFQLK